MHELWELKQKQALPLDIKIAMTAQRIRDWYEYYGDVYVSFSGGKDSTVLLDIVRRVVRYDIPAYFVNTGLEYPEVQKFAMSIVGKDNTLYPKMSFKDVITQYGYPFISKEVSETIYDVRLAKLKGNTSKQREDKLFGRAPYSGKSRYNQSKYIPLLETDFILSKICCEKTKKEPLRQLKDLKPITAQMAVESALRTQQWLKNGCNAFDAKKQISNPMSFWLEQDVLQYIKQYNLPYASVYGDLWEVDNSGNRCLAGCGEKLCFSGCQRTGCIFCGFGAHLDTRKQGISRFVRLRHSHPKQYFYCMEGGAHNQGIWKPTDKGLGMAHVIEGLNRLFSKTLKGGRVKKFIEY